MNSILAYIHTIDEAEYLIRYAAQFAKDLDRNVELLYTIELQNYPMGIPGAARPTVQYTHEQVESLFEQIRSKFDTEIDKIKRSVNEPPAIKYSTQQGISHHVIDEFTANNDYDYIIVASHSDNEYLINDRNMDIIKHVDIPVLIVPQNLEYRQIKTIIYATDYNEEDLDTMRKIKSLAKHGDGMITALHINQDPDFEEKVKSAGFKDLIAEKVGFENIEVTSLGQEGDQSLADTINEFAILVKADLIVALKENRGFFERLFRSSTTKKIISKTKTPVLVYSEND